MILKDSKKVTILVVMLVVMLLSIFVFSKVTTTPKFHAKTIESLDDKKATVLKLTAASAAAATAIAAIPGDATTPIANKLADLASYFVIILTMIFLEKYLVTLVGYATFTVIIPIACILFTIGLCMDKIVLKWLAAKLAVFGLVIFFVIPVSMKVSNIIDDTYDSSVATTVQAAQDTADEINETTDSDGNVIDRLISKIEGGITGLVTKGEELLNHFIESIAVMLVTSCVIPILVLLFAVWLVKILFGIEIKVPSDLPKRISRHKAVKSN